MREGRGLRRRVRGRGIADPDPSRRTGILLDPPAYLNGLPTARWAARRPDANFALTAFSEVRIRTLFHRGFTSVCLALLPRASKRSMKGVRSGCRVFCFSRRRVDTGTFAAARLVQRCLAWCCGDRGRCLFDESLHGLARCAAEEGGTAGRFLR